MSKHPLAAGAMRALDADAVSVAHRVFAGLSLDMAADALLGCAGREVDGAVLREILRRGVERLWTASDPASPSNEIAFVGGVLEEIEGALGERSTRTWLVAFWDAFLDPARDAQMFVWQQVFTFGGDAGGPAPALVRRARQGFAPPARASVTERTPRTPYDVTLFERYGYTLDPADRPDARSPMPELDGAAQRAGFLRAFRGAVSAAEDVEGELEATFRWGRAAGGAMGLPPEMLDDPSALVARPEVTKA